MGSGGTNTRVIRRSIVVVKHVEQIELVDGQPSVQPKATTVPAQYLPGEVMYLLTRQ